MHLRNLLAMFVGGLAGATAIGAQGAFMTFSGDATQELAWQGAAGGSVPIETFESFNGTVNLDPIGDPIISLPALHVTFDGPPYPGAYKEPLYAHSGSVQWSNFGAGAGNASMHVMRVDPNWIIHAVGFWNCDPQGAQTMEAYDFNDQLIGTVTAAINSYPNVPAISDSFAGFFSMLPIKYVKFPGTLGDGWNHFDDLQVLAVPVPEPASLGLAAIALLAALAALAARRIGARQRSVR